MLGWQRSNWYLLFGKKFSFGNRFLVTDQEALKYLLPSPTQSKHFYRWTLRSIGLRFKVYHRKGEDIPHVDSLTTISLLLIFSSLVFPFFLVAIASNMLSSLMPKFLPFILRILSFRWYRKSHLSNRSFLKIFLFPLKLKQQSHHFQSRSLSTLRRLRQCQMYWHRTWHIDILKNSTIILKNSIRMLAPDYDHSSTETFCWHRKSLGKEISIDAGTRCHWMCSYWLRCNLSSNDHWQVAMDEKDIEKTAFSGSKLWGNLPKVQNCNLRLWRRLSV